MTEVQGGDSHFDTQPLALCIPIACPWHVPGLKKNTEMGEEGVRSMSTEPNMRF